MSRIKKACLDVTYVRIYSMARVPPPFANAAVGSPVIAAGQPRGAIESKLHWGPIPAHILGPIKESHAWINGLLNGGVRSAEGLRNAAASLTDEQVGLSPLQSYLTFEIRDRLRLEINSLDPILGVSTRSFVSLDKISFFQRWQSAFNRVAISAAASIHPHRFERMVFENPWVHLPTGFRLRPPRDRMGAVRVYVSSSDAQADVSAILSPPSSSPSKSVDLAQRFYLRAYDAPDRTARFLDSFRALEALMRAHSARLRSNAEVSISNGAKGAAVEAFGKKKGFPKKFAALALAWNPTKSNDHFDVFMKVYRWRNMLVHGSRIPEHEEAPDEEAFNLAQEYVFRSL